MRALSDNKNTTSFRDTFPTSILVEDFLRLGRTRFDNPQETVDLIQINLATLELFFPWATANYDTNSFLAWKNSAKEKDNTCEYDYRVDGVLIGRFTIRINNKGVPEFGYWLGTIYAGHGYITKAIQAVLPILKELHYKEVEVCYLPNNQRSQATALRNGFKEFGLEVTALDSYLKGAMVMRAILALDESPTF